MPRLRTCEKCGGVVRDHGVDECLDFIECAIRSNARREGVIEGLERALELVREYDPCDLTSDFRAEIERLKEQP